MGAAAPDLAGALPSRYELLREVGHGGMATVHLARDRKHGRDVAIKVLLPEIAASLGAERFLREIRLAARLQHPHILPLYDSGDAGGALYFVMPFVEGESLRDHALLEEAVEVFGSRDRFVWTYFVGAADAEVWYELAATLADRGLTDEAMQALRRAGEAGWADRTWLSHDPAFEALREDPALRAACHEASARVTLPPPVGSGGID